jgi:hypothetical protein
MSRLFLLSPAHCGGKRARLILQPRSSFALARQLHQGQAVSIGAIFSFISGLYFRGKLAYAHTFAQAPQGESGTLVITPNRGLVEVDSPLTLQELNQFAQVPIDEKDPQYRGPLERSLSQLASRGSQVILLGSISTDKYVEVLLECLGQHVYFPAEFVGRGDMSRGGLLLRCVREGRELEYVPLAGAPRRGPRPPKLQPLPRKTAR